MKSTPSNGVTSSPPAEGAIHCEVVYATPQEQVVVPLALPAGATVLDALLASQLQQRFAEIGPAPTVGVFGRVVTPGHRLEAGDRVEIYRDLLADPRNARRARARIKR